MTDKQAQRVEVARLLSPHRLAPYAEAVGGNTRKALALYRWHAELAASLHELLGVTEVILRNAMDRELRAWHLARTGRESWLLPEPDGALIERPLGSLSNGKRLEATRWARKAADRRDAAHRRYGEQLNHDDVLANLTFGLWKDLLPNHAKDANPGNADNVGRKALWEEALVRSFPNVSDPDGVDTYWKVARLHHLRNRVAHMEPLLDLDIRSRVKDLLALVRSINEPTANWLSGANRVPTLLAQDPRVQKR